MARDLQKAMQPLYFSTTYFSKPLFHDTQEIHFNKEEVFEGISAFVHPLVKGKAIRRQGVKVNAMRPAYIKEALIHDALDNLDVLPSEDYMGSMSPMERERLIIGKNLTRLNVRRRNRIEVMAVEAIKYGTATIRGDSLDSLLDFGRHSDLVVTDPKNNWADPDFPIINHLEKMKMNVKKHSRIGAVANTVHINHTTFSYLRTNKQIRELYDTRRNVNITIELTPFQNYKDIEYAGSIGGFHFYIHSGNYIENGVQHPIIEDGEVILTASSIGGISHFGRIISEKAKFKPMPYFIRSYYNEELENRYYELHSAPLLVPHDVNATAYAKVALEAPPALVNPTGEKGAA